MPFTKHRYFVSFLMIFTLNLYIVFAVQAQSQRHKLWNTVLQKYVSSTGEVNYAGIKANSAQLESYLQYLSQGVSENASKAEKMAFWINAYNAFTVKLIIDNYPVKSIRDLKGGAPWKYKFIKIAGNLYCLDNIEHDILRGQFFDSRLHFVLVCAAKSCPRLLNEAYLPSKLNTQLNQQAKAFINNSSKNKLSKARVQISKIFQWYQDDFLKVNNIKSLRDYLNKYSNTKINQDAVIQYQTYDWSLNDSKY